LAAQSLDAATLAAWPRTTTGKLQLDRDVLVAHTSHPVLGPLARQRTLQKLLSVYGHGYLKHRHPVTQRLHPHYRILGTVAGRFGCSNPNIQQLPTAAELRQLVRADPGRRLVCADYSQIELRIAALLSQDALLLTAYATGADLHAQTAQALCGDATAGSWAK
jgi:DNA polymerase-1